MIDRAFEVVGAALQWLLIAVCCIAWAIIMVPFGIAYWVAWRCGVLES